MLHISKNLSKKLHHFFNRQPSNGLQMVLTHDFFCHDLFRLPKRPLSAVESAVGFEDYEKTWNNFNLAVPEYFNFSQDVLENWKQKEVSGQRSTRLPAFWWVDTNNKKEIQWSFSQLMQHSNRLSNVLDNCGIQPLDCVLVVLPKIPEWWLVNIACLKTGSILSPGTTSLTSKDIAYRLQASKAKCIITIPEIARLVDEVANTAPYLKTKLIVGGEKKGWLPFDILTKEASDAFQCVTTKSNDPMSWFFTSGTTALPKMVEHTHASYGLAHQITGKYWLDLTSNDVMWNLSDTGWAKSAYSSFFAPWWQGACVFVHNSPRFDPKETLAILKDYPVSVACLPPTAYRLMVLENLVDMKFKALRHSVSAGEPLNPEVIATWKQKTTLDIREGYGQTEMTICCGVFRCVDMRPGSMGKAAPGYDIQIISDDGEQLPAHEEGEIGVRCVPKRPVGLFTQYVNDEERTASVFRGDFYLTGDRGYKDEDGYIWFVGRSDDVIISSGYRIGPFEVESVLLEHPAVAESAVISSPCDIRGEIVKACIVLNAEFKDTDQQTLIEELQTHVKQSTAPHKYPRKIEFVESLPKTISGKIRRVELKRIEWNRDK